VLVAATLRRIGMKEMALVGLEAPVTRIRSPFRPSNELVTFSQTPKLCKGPPRLRALLGRATYT
jgi:hypothetical protein